MLQPTYQATCEQQISGCAALGWRGQTPDLQSWQQWQDNDHVEGFLLLLSLHLVGSHLLWLAYRSGAGSEHMFQTSIQKKQQLPSRPHKDTHRAGRNETQHAHFRTGVTTMRRNKASHVLLAGFSRQRQVELQSSTSTNSLSHEAASSTRLPMESSPSIPEQKNLSLVRFSCDNANITSCVGQSILNHLSLLISHRSSSSRPCSPVFREKS